MAYNKRLLFPHQTGTLAVEGRFVSSSVTGSMLNATLTFTGDNTIISSSAKVYFRETGSFGRIIGTSSILPTAFAPNLSSSVTLTDIEVPSEVRNLKNEDIFSIQAKFFSPNQTVFTNSVTSSFASGIQVLGAGVQTATYTSASVEYTIYRFLSSAIINIYSGDITAEILAVGGGGGGIGYGGGAGAGEVAYIKEATLPSGQHSILVGAGGGGDLNNGGDFKGGDGNPTTLFGETIRVGGGALGSDNTAGVGVNVSNGGAGGSRSAGHTGTVGTNNNIPFVRYGGNSGGRGAEAPNYVGSGGAGAGASTPNMPGSGNGGTGGTGVQVGTIYDGINNYFWGGGGGGSAYYTATGGNGGFGGGGNGTGPNGSAAVGTGGLNNGTYRTNINSGDGGINTGGGAGSGGGTNGAPTVRANGGSGIVLIKVATALT